MQAEYFVLQQQQNLGRRFGTSKMHLSFAIILMGKRELVALLGLSSCV